MSEVAQYDELEAVNIMLFSIGERPVNSLSGDVGDASLAQTVLRRTSKNVQMRGWLVNTRPEVVLAKNTDNQFAIGDNVLRADTVDPDPQRRVTTGSSQRPPSAHFNVARKRSQDDSKWLLYDIDRDAETWEDPDTLLVELILQLPFDELTPPLQEYVTAKAGREFQKGGLASRVVWEFTQQTEEDTEATALSFEAEDADINSLRASPTLRDIVQRRNYLWGR